MTTFYQIFFKKIKKEIKSIPYLKQTYLEPFADPFTFLFSLYLYFQDRKKYKKNKKYLNEIIKKAELINSKNISKLSAFREVESVCYLSNINKNSIDFSCMALAKK